MINDTDSERLRHEQPRCQSARAVGSGVPDLSGSGVIVVGWLRGLCSTAGCPTGRPPVAGPSWPALPAGARAAGPVARAGDRHRRGRVFRHLRPPGPPSAAPWASAAASTLWACRSAPGCTPARWRAHGREGRRDRPCIGTARSVTRRGEVVALWHSLPVRLPVRLPGYTGPLA